MPRVPKCGECKLATEGICPFAKKGGLKTWKEREAKKVHVKTEAVAKTETKTGPVSQVESVNVKVESGTVKANNENI